MGKHKGTRKVKNYNYRVSMSGQKIGFRELPILRCFKKLANIMKIENKKYLFRQNCVNKIKISLLDITRKIKKNILNVHSI